MNRIEEEKVVKKWGIGILVLGISCLVELSLLTVDSQAEEEQLEYGRSGHWESPVVSSLCGDSQRCVEWHDDTDGTGGPRTVCCVEEHKIPRNSYNDCEFPLIYWGPRDEG